MSSPSSAVLSHDFTVTYGIQLIGVFIGNILYGISFLQTFIYYMNSRLKNDHLLLKLLPAYLLVTHTLHQFLLCVTAYKVFVVDVFNTAQLFVKIPVEGFLVDIAQGWMVMGAQLFFVYRIWKFGTSSGRSMLVTISLLICTLLSVLQNVFKNVAVILALKHGSTTAYSKTTLWIGFQFAEYSINLFLDAVILVSMLKLLRHESRSTQFKETNAMINRLIKLTINSGLVTMAFSTLAIIFLATSTQTFIYVFWSYLFAPLYINSVLANLNSRDFIRGRGVGNVSTNFGIASGTTVPRFKVPGRSFVTDTTNDIGLETNSSNLQVNNLDSFELDKMDKGHSYPSE